MSRELTGRADATPVTLSERSESKGLVAVGGSAWSAATIAATGSSGPGTTKLVARGDEIFDSTPSVGGAFLRMTGLERSSSRRALRPANDSVTRRP